ncbi:MAG: hypothetical protein CXX83_01630 [Methanobacteriota archaeon]|nr:MAG: hypothetical protein CXX83_01630 [Euryarchaeota archaeon]
MANVNCYGTVISSRGAVVPLHNSATTEATQDEVRTDADFVGSAQVFGTFATQQHGNFVAARAGLQCENDFTWCYVQSAGKIKLALPIGGGAGASGGNCGLPAILPYPKQIASGDSIQVMVNAGTDREAAVAVACSSGEYHVFSKTPTGAGEQEFVSILDGQSLGLTLQGRVITHMFAVAGANDTELESPVYVLDGSGVPIGSVGFNAGAGDCAAVYEPVRIPVALNSRMVFRTDA